MRLVSEYAYEPSAADFYTHLHLHLSGEIDHVQFPPNRSPTASSECINNSTPLHLASLAFYALHSSPSLIQLAAMRAPRWISPPKTSGFRWGTRKWDSLQPCRVWCTFKWHPSPSIASLKIISQCDICYMNNQRLRVWFPYVNSERRLSQFAKPDKMHHVCLQTDYHYVLDATEPLFQIPRCCSTHVFSFLRHAAHRYSDCLHPWSRCWTTDSESINHSKP